MWTLDKIAEHIDGVVRGDGTFQVNSIGTLQAAKLDQISFLSNKKYKKYLVGTNAGAVIVDESMVLDVPNHAIIVDDPYVAYAKAASLLNPSIERPKGIDPTASVDTVSNIHPSASIGAHVVIESDVEIAENVIIGPGCVLLRGVKVGKATQLVANVTLCEFVSIGQNGLIHSGVVIGADGFGIANDKGKWIKVPQIGSVDIGDDVEIGANTTIDRGAIDNTTIGNGVKLDNQIQIGHNVVIGDNTVIAGCTGIAGSTQLGQNCIIGGGVGISGHLEICDGVQMSGMSMITKSITKPGVYSSGIPAEPVQQWHKNVIRYRQMDKLAERVKQLEILNKK